MAKKTVIETADKERQTGTFVYGIEQSRLEELVRESIHAQQATLNAMKIVADTMFGTQV